MPTRVQLFGLNLAQILSARLINETRLGYNRYVQTFTPLDAGFDPASIGLVTGSLSLPTITIPASSVWERRPMCRAGASAAHIRWWTI